MGLNINYQQCPCCGNKVISKALSAKDYTVSNEVFEIWHCNNCTLRFTQNVPVAEEIGPYYNSDAYVSHSDTSEGFINRVYHIVRNHTIKTKRKLVQQVTGLQKGSLLDIGAGTGSFSYTMKQNDWQITALEPDDTARKIAADKYHLQLQDPAKLYNLPAGQFDAITMWHVLEHVHDLHGYLERFFHVLKPSGRLIIAVPNYTSHDAQHYHQYWAAYDVPRHLYHFSPKSMDVLASLKGFTVKEYRPMWFDSFYVSMLSEQYKSGKGNLFTALWQGLLSNLKAAGNKKLCSSVIYVLAKK